MYVQRLYVQKDFRTREIQTLDKKGMKRQAH